MTIRFEISHPAGATHEVELPGPIVVLGRDPGCDIVLSDAKCSRRHAVVEEGPEGLVIRDAGSANGIYVNGRRLESSPLRPGDRVRLGEVTIRLLEDPGETVVVAPPDMEWSLSSPSTGVAAATPSRPREPVPGPSGEAPRPERTPSRKPAPRPLTVTVLSALWGIAAPLCVAAGVLATARTGLAGAAAAAVGGAGVALGAVSGLMALGLRAQAAWARRVQIAVAALGLAACPFTFASATVLLYMLRSDVRTSFQGGLPARARDGAGPAEATFALSLLGTLALGIALVAAAVLVFV